MGIKRLRRPLQYSRISQSLNGRVSFAVSSPYSTSTVANQSNLSPSSPWYQLPTMADVHVHNEKATLDTRQTPVVEVEKPADAHEEYVVDVEGKAVRIDYSGAHKKTDPEEIKYEACPSSRPFN